MNFSQHLLWYVKAAYESIILNFIYVQLCAFYVHSVLFRLNNLGEICIFYWTFFNLTMFTRYFTTQIWMYKKRLSKSERNIAPTEKELIETSYNFFSKNTIIPYFGQFWARKYIEIGPQCLLRKWLYLQGSVMGTDQKIFHYHCDF